jgi:hypothetical protein
MKRFALTTAAVFLLSPCFAAESDTPSSANWEDLNKAVAPSIVRICRDEEGKRYVHTGVVVSADGHVLTNTPIGIDESDPQERQGQVYFFSEDSRHGSGVLLGWSSEWNLGLYQITKGPTFKHVELSDKEIELGTECAAFQISNRLDNRLEQKLTLHPGVVTTSSPGCWFSASCQYRGFAPLFSNDGSLIGMTARRPKAGRRDLIATIRPPVWFMNFGPFSLNPET